MKKLLVLLITTFVLACGGSGGGSSVTEPHTGTIIGMPDLSDYEVAVCYAGTQICADVDIATESFSFASGRALPLEARFTPLTDDTKTYVLKAPSQSEVISPASTITVYQMDKKDISLLEAEQLVASPAKLEDNDYNEAIFTAIKASVDAIGKDNNDMIYEEIALGLESGDKETPLNSNDIAEIVDSVIERHEGGSEPIYDTEIKEVFAKPVWVNEYAFIDLGGDLIAYAAANDIVIYNVSTNSVEKILTGHTATVRSLALRQDGRIVSGSYDSTVKVWDADLSGKHSTLEGHKAYVETVSVFPDGRIISGSWEEGENGEKDQTIRVWDADLSGGHKVLAVAEDYSARKVVALPDGRLVSQLFLHGENGDELKIWDANLSGTYQIVSFPTYTSIDSFSLLANGRLVVRTSEDFSNISAIRVWDTALAPASMEVIPTAENEFGILTFSGRYIFSQQNPGFNPGKDTAILNLNLNNISSSINAPVNVATIEGHTSALFPVKVLTDGRIATGGTDGTIRIWKDDLSRVDKLVSGIADGIYNSFGTLPGGRLVSGETFEKLIVWKADFSGIDKLLQDSVLSTGRTTSIYTLPDGRIVTGTTAGYLAEPRQAGAFKVWDADLSGSSHTLMEIEPGNQQDVAVYAMPDGHIVTGENDGSIRVWNGNTYAQEAEIDAHAAEVVAFGVLPDERLVSGSWDGTIKVWKKDFSASDKTLTGHEDSITSLAVLPDGRILSSSWDGTVKLWKADLSGVEASINSHRGVNLQAWGDKWIGDNSGVISVFEIE